MVMGLDNKETKDFPSESGHWYDKEGKPAYSIIGKNGNERPTTLRDARTLKLYPSVTTILKVADKPGLNRWMIQNTLMAALTLPMLPDESLDAYSERVMADSKEQSFKAMELGTSIHGSLEKAYEGKPFSPEHKLHVAASMHCIAEHYGEQKWAAERSFSSEIGFGGKLDLSSDSVVIDFKTKDFKEGDKVIGYDEHKMQLAAYAKGLGLESYRAANVFVSTKEPGLVKLVEYSPGELECAWGMFYHLLQFWQIKNKYRREHEA